MAYKQKKNIDFSNGTGSNSSPKKLNFLTGMGKAGSFNPFLGEQGLDVQGTVDMVKEDLDMIKNMKAAKKNYFLVPSLL